MSEPLDRGQLLKLTSEVVAAYVSSHRVAPTELEVIIGSVAGSLAEVGDPPQAVPARPEPAVPARRSVGKDHLICLMCGKKQKTLKRHLAVRHSSLRTNTGNVSACVRVPDGGAELCGAAFRVCSADRVWGGSPPCRASCSATQARANQAEVIKASHSFRSYPRSRRILALHTKNMEYSGWGSPGRPWRGRSP